MNDVICKHRTWKGCVNPARHVVKHFPHTASALIHDKNPYQHTVKSIDEHTSYKSYFAVP